MRSRGDETFTYDSNGNQTKEVDSISSTTTEFTYDADNRLKTAKETAGSTVEFTQTNKYNGFGQRVQKKETVGGTTDTVNYFYDGTSVLYTTDGSSAMTALNLIGAEDNILATARPASSGADFYVYTKDLRESTINMVGADGTAPVSYNYTDYGETEVLGDQDFYNEVCYGAGIYDKTTGLYYLNARYYSPESGAFLTQDTYRGDRSRTATLNLYAYCANNPINYVDPSGHARNIRNRKYYSTVKTFYFTPKTSYKVYISFTMTIYWKVKNGKIFKSNISETLYGKYKVSPRRHAWRAKRFYRDIIISNSKKTAYYKAKIYIENLYNWAASTSIRYKITLNSNGGRDWKRQ